LTVKQTPPMYNAQCAAQLNLCCCYYNGSFSNCILKLYQIIIITILNKFGYVLNSEQISVIIWSVRDVDKNLYPKTGFISQIKWNSRKRKYCNLIHRIVHLKPKLCISENETIIDLAVTVKAHLLLLFHFS
jgi:hypothetical protein